MIEGEEWRGTSVRVVRGRQMVSVWFEIARPALRHGVGRSWRIDISVGENDGIKILRIFILILGLWVGFVRLLHVVF